MVLLKIDDKNIWDKFVDSNKNALLFHKWDFLKTIEKYTNYELLTYGIYYETQLIGILPLFVRKIASLNMVFSPPPRTAVPYLGYLIHNDYNLFKQDKKEKFLQIINKDINKAIKELKSNYTAISLIPEMNDIRSFLWDKFTVHLNYTYVIDTSVELTNIWDSFKKETRKKIKQAQDANIKIVQSDDSIQIYKKMEERYLNQKINIPVISKEYLNDLKKLFPNNIIFNLAVLDNKMIGSEVIIRYNNKHIDWLGGVKPEEDYPVNELLIWNSLQKCKESDIKEMDMTGANNKQISNFKSQFNPKLIPTYNIIKSNTKGNCMEWIYKNIIKKKYY